MVVFIPAMKEFDQVREIKESFHEEEFMRKDLKDIDALFVKREREEHYKQKEHLLFFQAFQDLLDRLPLLFLYPHLYSYLIQNEHPEKTPLLSSPIHNLPFIPPKIGHYPHYTIISVLKGRREEEREKDTELILIFLFSIKNLPIH